MEVCAGLLGLLLSLAEPPENLVDAIELGLHERDIVVRRILVDRGRRRSGR